MPEDSFFDDLYCPECNKKSIIVVSNYENFPPEHMRVCKTPECNYERQA